MKSKCFSSKYWNFFLHPILSWVACVHTHTHTHTNTHMLAFKFWSHVWLNGVSFQGHLFIFLLSSIFSLIIDNSFKDVITPLQNFSTFGLYIIRVFNETHSIPQPIPISHPRPSLCAWIHFRHHHDHVTTTPKLNYIYVQINNHVLAIVSLVINLS